ncbi:MAG: hypothetical protein BAJALOKI2v1_230028 [Promethearchaeota archaeon]|nr:MAG: hypothetical protein BAJALOKI2v1_230028 [Candidatus Lokiarchaeota archaeon]
MKKVIMTFFNDEELARRIRYLHFNIKHLEEALERDEEDFSLDDLNYILEYTRILNLNYGNENHKEILKDLDITQSYMDLVEEREIEINDIMFECARTLWVLARAYSCLSEKFEEEEEWQNSIVSMVEASKIYKAAAYFSTASVNQKDIGESLNAENLEINSEESRIWAQGIAADKEEQNNNIYFASKLYAGLSALSKRLFYLKKHNEKKKQQIRAQFHYDMGRACDLKAQASNESSLTNIKKDKIQDLQNKALFYYNKADKIWNLMLEKIKMNDEEEAIIENNLEIVSNDIEKLDAEELDYEDIKRIQDPEPIIIVPENLAPFVPKSTVYLTKFVPKDLNIKRFKNFQNKKLEKKIPYSKKEKLLDKKAGVLRTINELKVLKEENEIDVDKFAKLMEKYSTKLKMIDTAIEKLARS